MVDLADQPRFFVRVAVDFTIDGVVLIRKKITVGFFGLFL